MAKKAAAKKIARPTRFAPDPGTLAEIRFNDEELYVFGLVINESSGGCALVMHAEKAIPVGATCLCKVGNLDMTNAEVRWVKALDTNIFKVGIQYHLD